ncbi:hypothetical protein SAMN05660479_02624 [Microbulbifer thermotolerans]|nr:hypothetical protein SAMN05660479_02624 [Microbulbifer thermotolerans]
MRLQSCALHCIRRLIGISYHLSFMFACEILECLGSELLGASLRNL